MATSIRDLIRVLESEAPQRAGTHRQAPDAAAALAQLGRALALLTADGLDLEVTSRRDDTVRDLAESCKQNAATVHPDHPDQPDQHGRLTNLAGSIADVIAMLRKETGREQRWAIALEVASAVRVLTTYAAEGDGRRTADLAWTHLTARALIAQSLNDSPSQASQAALDRAIPSAFIPADLPPAQAAMESLIVISDRLRRAAVGLARRPTLLEIFAVTRAAESTTRYATATRAALAGQPIPDARPAAAIWYEVRSQLRTFATTAPLRLEDRDLGLWAQQAHSELRREFGTPDKPQVHADGRVKLQALEHLGVMVNEIPAIADHLVRAVEQLCDQGELHALATRLPYRISRLEPYLASGAIVADRIDIAPIVDRLRDAGRLAAGLAADLARISESDRHLDDRTAGLPLNAGSLDTRRTLDSPGSQRDNETTTAPNHDLSNHLSLHVDLSIGEEFEQLTAPEYDIQ